MYRHRILTREEEREFGRRWREDNDVDARNALVLHNTRFAASVAEKYRDVNLDFEDIMSAAISGLITAVDRFDERKGYRLISYAVWWIRHAIQDELAHANPIRLPSNRVSQATKARQRQERMEQEQLREVSLEIASGMSPRRFADLVPSLGSHVELDAPLEDGDLPADTPDLEVRARVRSLLRLLFPIERRILELRHGFDSDGPRTLDEIGEIVGLSRERVRQIERAAMARLRRG